MRILVVNAGSSSLKLRLLDAEDALAARSGELVKAQEEVRLREARLLADIELREDKLDDLARQLAAREQLIGQREHDLAGYVGELQTKFQERELDWWTKQLGHTPETV